jgi:nicotinamidase-related amidase
MLPPTLLEISGAAYPAGRLADSAVVIVDAQRVYIDGRLPLPGIDCALTEIARLLARARADRFARVLETVDEIPD